MASSITSLMTTRETYGRLGVKRTTLFAFVKRGWLTPIRFSQRCVRFDPYEVESFIASRQQQKGGDL